MGGRTSPRCPEAERQVRRLGWGRLRSWLSPRLLVLLWRWTLFCAEREMPVWGPMLEPMRRAAHPSEPQPATASSTRPDALPRPVRRASRGVPADTKRRESRHAAQNAIGFCVCSAVISEPSGPGLPAEPPACPFCESGSFGVTDGREEPAQWPRQPPSSLASTAPKGFHGLPPRARGKGWVLYLAHRKVRSHFENELR